MLISLNWLKDYVDISGITPEQIAHELTMSGLEVEEIEQVGSDFTNIRVAEIIEMNPHPNADKLRLVTINNGTEKKTVVCGAQNIEVGQIIPYASVGSEVKDRHTGEKFTLKPAKIRNVESEGMLCSADELGLNTSDYQEDDGILILNRFLKDLTIGQDVKDVLNIYEDTVLHIAPTANRGDEMSLIGVAREISAIFDRKLNFSKLELHQEFESTGFKVEIKDEKTCNYYAIGILKDVKIKPSPEWMKNRLIASGVRSINNVVDITNYVMLEYGQPLHAFDLDKLSGNYLCVRRADENEKMTTLDEVERKLTQESVVIATEKEPVALAGLMGGFTSEVDDNTVNIALESAYFTPPTNRKSAKSVGLRTEASARFERGVDITNVKPALYRAMQLMAELADAKVIDITETGSDKTPEIEITLRFAQINRILGIEIPTDKCINILENLGFDLIGKNGFSAKFAVPGHRINDVTREIDLLEEITRIYGYDKIEPTLPKKTQPKDISQEEILINKIHNIFLGQGFYEAVTSSLIGKPLLEWVGMDYNDEQAVKVTNPQSEEHTMLRQSVIPNIINVVKHNLDKGQKNVWIYEIGKTFFFTGENLSEKTTGVKEKRNLAGAITGSLNLNKWNSPKVTDFYSLKGIIESLFKEFKLENRLEYSPAKNIPFLHPGRSAEVKLLGKNALILGYFGELHPEIMEKCKLNQPVYIFNLDLEEIINSINIAVPRYKELPVYPAVNRDIAFIVPKSVSHQDILKAIKKASSNLFIGAEVFDIYQGKNIDENAKSVAYRINLQDLQATLTDEKVDEEMNKIRAGLKKSFPEASFRE